MARIGIVVLQQHVVAQVARARAAACAHPSAASGCTPGTRARRTGAARRARQRARRAVADRHVQAVALEVLHARVGADAHVDAGMLAREAGKARDQPERGEGMRGGDRRACGASGLRAQPVGGRAHRRQHLRRRRVELLARPRSARARGGGARTGLHAQLRLELLHLPADGRLREVQLFPGAREGQQPRRRLEAAQQVERGQPAFALRIPDLSHAIACPAGYLPFRHAACRRKDARMRMPNATRQESALIAESKLQPGALRLARGQTLKVTDALGSTICCSEGSVWITEENSRKDVVLEAGGCYQLARPASTLVQRLRRRHAWRSPEPQRALRICASRKEKRHVQGRPAQGQAHPHHRRRHRPGQGDRRPGTCSSAPKSGSPAGAAACWMPPRKN